MPSIRLNVRKTERKQYVSGSLKVSLIHVGINDNYIWKLSILIMLSKSSKLCIIKKYRKILRQVILKAKKMANESYISKSNNKTKATWSVIKSQLELKQHITRKISKITYEYKNIIKPEDSCRFI